jgi:hypothetical protein
VISAGFRVAVILAAPAALILGGAVGFTAVEDLDFGDALYFKGASPIVT